LSKVNSKIEFISLRWKRRGSLLTRLLWSAICRVSGRFLLEQINRYGIYSWSENNIITSFL